MEGKRLGLIRLIGLMVVTMSVATPTMVVEANGQDCATQSALLVTKILTLAASQYGLPGMMLGSWRGAMEITIAMDEPEMAAESLSELKLADLTAIETALRESGWSITYEAKHFTGELSSRTWSYTGGTWPCLPPPPNAPASNPVAELVRVEAKPAPQINLWLMMAVGVVCLGLAGARKLATQTVQ